MAGLAQFTQPRIRHEEDPERFAAGAHRRHEEGLKKRETRLGYPGTMALVQVETT